MSSISLRLREPSPLCEPRSNRVGSAAKKKEKQTTDVVCFSLAAEPGFEPRMTESEAGVLPLHYSAELRLQPFTLVYSITTKCVCQYFF